MDNNSIISYDKVEQTMDRMGELRIHESILLEIVDEYNSFITNKSKLVKHDSMYYLDIEELESKFAENVINILKRNKESLSIK